MNQSSNQVYFDFDQLTKSIFFRLKEEIKTQQGKVLHLDKWIGRGGNASIFKAHYRSTGEKVAIKFLLNYNPKNKERFKREINLLKDLRNDFVTQYHGEGKVRAVKRNKTRHSHCRIHFVVMDLADCNLTKKMENKQVKVPYEEYAGQFRGLANALSRLHDIGVVHRDIKPENILVVGDRLILSDFGLCSKVRREERDLTQQNGNVGPKFWLSPEAHNRRIGCGDKIQKSSDVFQLAAIFWYIVTGRHPSGIVSQQDWTDNGTDRLFKCLQRSLYHDHRRRPQDGVAFFNEIEFALS